MKIKLQIDQSNLTRSTFDRKTEVSETKAVFRHGEQGTLDLVIEEPVVLTLPRGVRDSLAATLDINSIVEAPIAAGDVLGSLRVELDGDTIFTGELKAGGAIEAAGFLASLWDSISLFFLQLFGGDPLVVTE